MKKKALLYPDTPGAGAVAATVAAPFSYHLSFGSNDRGTSFLKEPTAVPG